MKKSSKSKRAWILAGAMIFGGAALISTGLATWVIGVNVSSQDEAVTVNVDTAVNNSYRLSMDIDVSAGGDATIYLTENTQAQSGWGNWLSYLDSTREGDQVDTDALKITFSSISITIGDNLNQIPTAIVFSLPSEDSNGNTVNSANIATNDLCQDRGNDADSWTYVEAPSSIDIDFSDNGNFRADTSGNGQTKYTPKPNVNVTTVEFKWGSFFNNTSPLTYYHDKYDAEYDNLNDEQVDELQENILTELNAMHDALNGKTLTLRAELQMTAATTDQN